MKRRAAKNTRANGAASVPTPIPSTYTTPTSSAFPSAYNTENEYDPDEEVNSIPIGTLTLRSPKAPAPLPPKRQKTLPFPFLALPTEIRLKIYEFHFGTQNRTVDLNPTNYKDIHKKLALIRTCRQVYTEASHFFYNTNTFRMFPTHPGRFFKTKKPLLARLSPRQRQSIAFLELRLGPGWNKPPRGWVVNEALGLGDCVNLRKLTVFVECDPSDGIFNGFRRADGFYEGFCQELLDGVLAGMPWLTSVEFDAWSSVKKSGAMMQGLLDIATLRGRMVTWGPERGWTNNTDDGTDMVPTVDILDATGLPDIMVSV